MIQRTRTIRWVHIVGGVVTVVFLAVIITLTKDSSKGDSSTTPGRTDETPSAPVTARSDPPDLSEQKKEVTEVAENFVAAYYYRDASLTDKSYAQRVRPYATENFVENALPPLSSVLDEKIRELNVAVNAKGKVISGESEETRSYVDVKVRIFPSWNANSGTSQPSVISLEIVEEDGRFLVNQLAE